MILLGGLQSLHNLPDECKLKAVTGAAATQNTVASAGHQGGLSLPGSDLSPGRVVQSPEVGTVWDAKDVAWRAQGGSWCELESAGPRGLIGYRKTVDMYRK